MVEILPHPAEEIQMVRCLAVLKLDQLMHLLHTGLDLIIDQQIVVCPVSYTHLDVYKRQETYPPPAPPFSKAAQDVCQVYDSHSQEE